MREELHNNHHAFATSAKLSSKWYEFDIGWMYIRILQMLGMAKPKKTIPTPKFGLARSVPDGDMLQAIITHRYDVMTRYLRSLKQTYHEEIEQLRAKHSGTFTLKAGELRQLILSDNLQASEAAQRQAALEHSERLATLESMREELSALWARSTASKDQLLLQLRDWVERAERSGIAQLQEFAQRLRCYAA